MSEENIWSVFENLERRVYAQDKRIRELEERLADLEARLNEVAKPTEVKRAA